MKYSILFLLLVSWILASVTALATTDSLESSESVRRVVFIAPNSKEELTLRLVEAIEQRVFDLNVSLSVEWIDGPTTPHGDLESEFEQGDSADTIAFMWLEQTQDGDRIVMVSNQPGGTWSLSRVVDLESYQAASESIGLMARTFLTALFAEQLQKEDSEPETHQLENETIKNKPIEEVPDNPPSDIQEPPIQKHQPRFSIFTGYSLLFDSQDAAPVQGFSLLVSFGFNDWLRAYLGYSVLERTDINTIQTDLSLMRHPIGLGLSVGTPINRLMLSGSLGLSVDYITIEATPHSAAFELNDINNYVQLAIVPTCTLEFVLTTWLRLFVRIGGDILLKRPVFTAGSVEHRETIYKPWPVHLKLSMGLVFTLF